MIYERKTIDYYKMEQFINGKWETILDTDDYDEYKKLYNELIWKPRIKYRGKKYRRIKEGS